MSLRRLLKGLRWYLREISGEARYDHYLRHHRRLHPGAPALTRREFERAMTDRAERSPATRCC